METNTIPPNPVPVQIWMPKEMHRILRTLAYTQGVSMRKVILDSLQKTIRAASKKEAPK